MGVLSYVQHMLLFCFVLAMGGLFWFMLSMCTPFGYGDLVYKQLAAQSSYFGILGAISGGMTVSLVILDIFYWRGAFWYIARLLVAINTGFYFLTALAGTRRFPASPVAVYFCACPMVLFVIKIIVLPNVDPVSFLKTTGVSLLVVSIATTGIFLAYAFGYGNYWNNETRLDYYTRLECIPPGLPIPAQNLTFFLDLIDVQSGCDEGFLLWISPIIMAIFAFAMSGTVLMIVHAERRFTKGKSKVDIQVRAFLSFLLLGFLGLWIAGGVAAADVGMSSIVFAFTFLFMVIGCSAIVFVQGLQSFASNVKEQPLIARLFSFTKSDWMKSLLLVIFFPLFIVVIPLAFLNQMGRRYVPFTKKLDAEEFKLRLSIEISKRLTEMKKWNWTSVLTKIIWWGILFFSLSVICARFINVFFSWLQDVFVQNNISIAGATGIFIAVGLLGLLAPPIPAGPIYIASSVILIPVCEREGWDFWLSWLYASVVSLAVKLIGCIGQQKCIGEWFGSNSVWVRRTVGVNSVEMRAIKKILLNRKLTFPKVAILVGGPDWPTSVGAGILKTPLIPNVIGTIPVFFLILPMSLAGALILRANLGGIWVSAAAMALAVAGLQQMIMLAVVAYYVEDAIDKYRDELEQWPDDEEVKAFDEKSATKERMRSYVSQWHKLPLWLKFFMIVGVIAETASAYLFQLAGSRCFLNFSITDDIATMLNNNVINIILPLGWVGIGLVVTGNIVLIMLGRWITYQCKGFIMPPEEEERLRRASVDVAEEDDEVGGYKASGVVAPTEEGK